MNSKNENKNTAPNDVAKENGNGKRGWVVSFIRRLFMLAILVAVVGGGVIYWQRLESAPTVVQKQAPHQTVMPVHAITLEPEVVPLRPVFLGQTEASQQVEIRARVNGFLESRHFKEGGRVKTGQLLFSIDPRSFQAELDMAQARLASAQAQLGRAQQKVRRYSQLLESGAVTADEMEQWQTEETVAEANIQLEKANITQARLDLSYTSITSPINGRIGMALKDVGSYVDNSSGGLLAVVEKTDPIYVRYTLSEQDILAARRLAESGRTSRPAQKKLRLTITLADGAPYPHAGEITYEDPQIDTETGSAVMRGTFPNPDGVLKPGQFVHVEVQGVDRLDALLVPKEAVLQNPTGAMVYVVNDQNQAELRPVTLGPWHGEEWIVETGLKAGDKVIVDRLMKLRPGMQVDPSAVAQAGPAATEATSNVEKM